VPQNESQVGNPDSLLHSFQHSPPSFRRAGGAGDGGDSGDGGCAGEGGGSEGGNGDGGSNGGGDRGGVSGGCGGENGTGGVSGGGESGGATGGESGGGDGDGGGGDGGGNKPSAATQQCLSTQPDEPSPHCTLLVSKPARQHAPADPQWLVQSPPAFAPH